MAYAPYLHLTARLRSWQLRAVKKSFQPEAILTVGHGYSWITAAALARDLDIPLHFIVHDDWPNSNHLPGYFQRWLNLKFSAVYREASSRLCVSLNMAEKYEERYGVKGEVLLPSRAVDTPSYSSPPVSSDIQFPVFAYAGSINSRETAQALTLLAEVLRPLHGKVHLYSAFSSGALKSLGLTAGNIFVQPTLGSNDLISTLRNSAHVLFLPMDFEGSRNAELNFPSKLVDYTATGLPVLIFGPTKCSAVRWASQFPDTAAVVTSNDAETLSREVLRLVEDTTYRSRLGKFALIKGRECFSHAAVTEKFHRLVAI
jgi:hypothetical protein